MRQLNRRIILPRIVLRDRRAPPPKLGVQVRPHHLRYEVGRYREYFRSGPGGLGRGRTWVPTQVVEQHNLVLDNTFDYLMPNYGLLNLAEYAAVGTGSGAPSATDTYLANELARTNQRPPDASDAITREADGLYTLQVAREFDESQVGGQNLTEWGFSPTPSETLMCRELFRDGSGNPIALSIAPDQKLRLIYSYQVQLGPVTPVDATFTAGPISASGKYVLTNGASPDDNEDLWLADQTLYGTYVSIAPIVDDRYPPSYGTNGYPGHVGYTLGLENYAGDRKRRTQDTTFDTGDANVTWFGIAIATGDIAGLIFVFDPSTAFTKDDLHRLTIFGWDLITW